MNTSSTTIIMLLILTAISTIICWSCLGSAECILLLSGFFPVIVSILLDLFAYRKCTVRSKPHSIQSSPILRITPFRCSPWFFVSVLSSFLLPFELPNWILKIPQMGSISTKISSGWPLSPWLLWATVNSPLKRISDASLDAFVWRGESLLSRSWLSSWRTLSVWTEVLLIYKIG